MRTIAIALCLAAMALLAGCTSSSDSIGQGVLPTISMTSEAPTDLDVWMARNTALLWLQCPDGDVRWALTDPDVRRIGIAVLEEDGTLIREIPPEPRSWDQTSPPVITTIWESSRSGDRSVQSVTFDVLLPGGLSAQQIDLSRQPGGSWRVGGGVSPLGLDSDSGCGP